MRTVTAAVKNSCLLSPLKVLSYPGGMLCRSFKDLRDLVRRAARLPGCVSRFCKLFEATRRFRPRQENFNAAGHDSDIRLKQRLTHSLPQQCSICGLWGSSKSRRRAVEGEQGRKRMRIGSVDRFRFTHKMDKTRRVVAQAASTRTSTLRL